MEIQVDENNIPEDIMLHEYFLLYLVYTKSNSLDNILSSMSEERVEKIALGLQFRLYIKAASTHPSGWIFLQKSVDMLSSLETNKCEAEDIFNYYKATYEKYTGKSSRIKFSTISKWLKTRCKNDLTLEGAKQVIDYKFKEWWGTDMQKHCKSFATLLGPTHYNNYLVSAQMDDSTNEDFSNDI
jgi:uncharacterized phage protein (TIGR02220 family)